MDSDFFQHYVQVRIITELPDVSGLSLSEIQYEIDEGGSTGNFEVVFSRQLTGREVVDACREVHTDPSFLLQDAEAVWFYSLGPGDNFTDPVDGKRKQIRKIEFTFDTHVVIVTNESETLLFSREQLIEANRV